jgi:hypothetical protein
MPTGWGEGEIGEELLHGCFCGEPGVLTDVGEVVQMRKMWLYGWGSSILAPAIARQVYLFAKGTAVDQRQPLFVFFGVGFSVPESCPNLDAIMHFPV